MSMHCHPGIPSLMLLAVVLASLIASNGRTEDKKSSPTLGTIERKDPRLDALLPKNARLEKLADGFDWSEGPVWVKDDSKAGGYLLFSDIPKNTIWKWQEQKGISLFMKPSGYSGTVPFSGKEPGSNGLLLDPEGRLVLCEHGDRRVSRVEKDGTKKTLADKYEGKRFNSPNDAVYHSNGDLYFTDPPYGLPKQMDDPSKELDFQGVYRLSKSGELTLLTKDMTRPNGIALSPDEKTLYVANSDPVKAVWMTFPVKEDGTLGGGKVFHDSTSLVGKKPGLPDGMKVDMKGNIFATGPGGVYIFNSAGDILGVIDTGVPTANCGWGNDGSVLYVTADKNLCRIKTTTKGKGF